MSIDLEARFKRLEWRVKQLEEKTETLWHRAYGETQAKAIKDYEEATGKQFKKAEGS
ncbi:hypothetical protein ES703_36781 [subsurface metagenome]